MAFLMLRPMPTTPLGKASRAGRPQTDDGASGCDPEAAARFFLPAGYRARLKPSYFADAGRLGIVHQPDVYPYAAVLADRMGATWLIDIGCGRAGKLMPFRARFRLFGIDYGENIRWCREKHADDTWLDWDLTRPDPLSIPEHIARDAVVICADVIEHLPDPVPLVRNLANLATRSRAVVISTPDRVLVHGPDDRGPPKNPAHVREWSLSELVDLFSANGAAPVLAGHTRNNDRASLKRTILLTFGRDLEPPSQPAPTEFSVLGVVCTSNDVDVIEAVTDHLCAQGIRLHLIDGWSTDGTFQRATDLAAGSDRVTVERFPSHGPVEHPRWATLLRRVEHVASAGKADWIIFQAANEIRRPPWPAVSLRDGLWAVDRAGYNVVNHTVVQLPMVDRTDHSAANRIQHCSQFEFGQLPPHHRRMRAWKCGPKICIAARGGYDAPFVGARFYPLNFTSLRFAAPGNAQATALLPYDEASFTREYLTELVAGVNLPAGEHVA
jgi:SAM-dependent methyltransferase